MTEQQEQKWMGNQEMQRSEMGAEKNKTKLDNEGAQAWIIGE